MHAKFKSYRSITFKKLDSIFTFNKCFMPLLRLIIKRNHKWGRFNTYSSQKIATFKLERKNLHSILKSQHINSHAIQKSSYSKVSFTLNTQIHFHVEINSHWTRTPALYKITSCQLTVNSFTSTNSHSEVQFHIHKYNSRLDRSQEHFRVKPAITCNFNVCNHKPCLHGTN